MKTRKIQYNPVQRRLLRRFELPVIILISLLPVMVTVGGSYYWTISQIEREMSFLADATARRSENILKITQSNLKQLAEHTLSQCNSGTMKYMQEKVFSVMYIRETGIVQNNRLMCNNVTLFDPPVDITEIEHRRLAEQNGQISIVPPVPTLQGGKSILINYRVNQNSYVNALIDPDIFHEFHDYVRLGEVSGVFLVREDGKTVISFGSMSARDLPQINDDSGHLLHFHGNLFALYKSGNFPIYAVVSSSSSFVMKHWRIQAIVLGVLGIVSSCLLFFFLKGNRRSDSLLQGELWRAIENNELCLHYQPIMALGSRRCVGAEALMRWHHPEQGLLMPLVFLPIAEQTGIIRALTHWLINRIEAELGDFLKNNPDIHISINLSSFDLGCGGHKSSCEDLLFPSVPHQQVIYEITEQSLIPDHALSADDMIQSLRKKGARVALDDFGTGYCSLGYLQRFPVDYIKIDKGFIDGIMNETTSASLVDHIISIAHTMNFEVIAEGIEYAYQQNYLKDSGVKYGQGWYFSKPLPWESFLSFVAEANKCSEKTGK